MGQDCGEAVTLGGTNWASQVVLAVTSPPASAGGARTSAPSLVWKIPGGGRGSSLQCSVVNWTGARRAVVHRVAQRETGLKRLSRRRRDPGEASGG